MTRALQIKHCADYEIHKAALATKPRSLTPGHNEHAILGVSSETIDAMAYASCCDRD